MKKKTFCRIALLITLLFIFILVCSFAFTIMHSDHHCEGRLCSVCSVIETNNAIIKLFSTLGALFILIAFSNVFSIDISRKEKYPSVVKTPLLMKVKLNN